MAEKPPHPDIIPTAGATLTWDGLEFAITSLSVAASGVENDIDISSMSSRVTFDKNNTDKKFIDRDTDQAYSGKNVELTMEYFPAPGLDVDKWDEAIGRKRMLEIRLPRGDGSIITSGGDPFCRQWAILTGITANIGVGDYVRGSITFRLTGEY